MQGISDVNIHLRVFHRSQKDIVLLWSLEHLSEDQKKNIKILCNGTPLKFMVTEHNNKDKSSIANNTMVCVIDHEANGLNPNAQYTFDVILGGTNGEPIMRKIVVLKTGVLPAFDKDKKSARVHLMAWDYSINAWVKIPAVKNKEYGYAIPVVVVGENKK